jgi:hypothetical protein
MDTLGVLFLYLVGVAAFIDAILILFFFYHWIEKYLP